MGNQEKHDSLLLTLARDHDNIEGLLDTFFSFLARRTDFFHVMTEQRQKEGFPEGVAEKMTLGTFRKYQKTVCGNSESNTMQHRSTLNDLVDTQIDQHSAKEDYLFIEGRRENRSNFVAAANIESSSVGSEVGKSTTDTNHKDWSHISAWNGGITDKYRWTQTQTELTLELSVPSPPCFSKEIKVHFPSSNKIKVTCRGEAILEGNFPEKVKRDECVWTLEDNRRLMITLDKSREMWWTKVLEGDPEIDGTKIESKKNIDEFPQEAQGAIRKIMFDRSQQAKGLLTSDQMAEQEMLRKAWDVEGSPFKGTPFNPACVLGNSGTAGMMNL